MHKGNKRLHTWLYYLNVPSIIIKVKKHRYRSTSNHVSIEKILNQMYTFMIFQDGRYSISLIFSKIWFNTVICMSTVTLFTKFHVNTLSITIAMTFWSILSKSNVRHFLNGRRSRKFQISYWVYSWTCSPRPILQLCKCSCFTTIWILVLKICTNPLD